MYLVFEDNKDFVPLQNLIEYMVKKLNNISAFDVTFKNSKNVPFQRWYPYNLLC